MTVFEIVEADLSKLAQGGPFLGLWNPQAPLTELSFDINANPAPKAEGVIWKVNLPGDLKEAQASLRVAESQVNRSQAAIANAKTMLHNTLQTQQQIDPVSYSSLITTPTTLEEELSFALTEIQLTGTASTSSGVPREPQNWQAASYQLQNQLEQLMQSIFNYAWVETQLEAQFLARTGVDWTGDIKAIWHPSIDLERVTLHQRSITLAVNSRNTLIKVLGLAIGGLMQLSKFSNPVTAMLALPSIWRYINRVIELRAED